jgi:hypothetical protein
MFIPKIKLITIPTYGITISSDEYSAYGVNSDDTTIRFRTMRTLHYIETDNGLLWDDDDPKHYIIDLTKFLHMIVAKIKKNTSIGEYLQIKIYGNKHKNIAEFLINRDYVGCYTKDNTYKDIYKILLYDHTLCKIKEKYCKYVFDNLKDTKKITRLVDIRIKYKKNAAILAIKKKATPMKIHTTSESILDNLSMVRHHSYRNIRIKTHKN